MQRSAAFFLRAGIYMRGYCFREWDALYQPFSSIHRRQGILFGRLQCIQNATCSISYQRTSYCNVNDRVIKQQKYSYCSLFEKAGISKYNFAPERYASSIWQCTDVLQKSDSEKSEETTIHAEKPASTVTGSSAPEIQCASYEIQPAFKRQLGGIEAMYEHYNSRGSDVSSIIAGVQSVYDISEEAVRWALQRLMIRHPLLRSSISYERQSSGDDKVQTFFVENKSLEPDFEALDRSDWLNFVLEEPNRTFDNPTLPLWRVRMLQAADDTDGYFCPSSDDSTSMSRCSDRVHMHNTVFIITVNHTIMDAAYCTWIVQELITLLDAYVMKSPIGEIRKLQMLMPIETCIQCPPSTKDGACDIHSDDPLCQARLYFNASDTFILDAYNTRYSEEINKLSKQSPQTGSLYLKLSQKATSSFLSACKREDVKTIGALTTACVLALVDLIFPETVQLPDFEIPIEHEIDLRRIFDIENVDKTNVPFYTGVATTHFGVGIRISSFDRPIDKSTFWNIAGTYAKFSSNRFGKPNKTVFNTVQNSKDHYGISKLRKSTKKSPYVLCISNIGNIDHVLQDIFEERIKVTSLVPHINILNEDMPIFFISSQTLNGQLTVLISYCKSYTSTQTAQCYMEKLNNYIHQYSK